jgi:hypothetical protein
LQTNTGDRIFDVDVDVGESGKGRRIDDGRGDRITRGSVIVGTVTLPATVNAADSTER